MKASIRNSLDSMRWIDVNEKTLEKEGAILCWDNISKEILKRDMRLYSLLFFGYNRTTDTVSIASSEGGNKKYKVFCPKIISSVEPLHLDFEFSELRRRLIVVPHKPFERFTSVDKRYYRGRDLLKDKLDIDSINWEGIDHEYLTFWSNHEICKSFVVWRKALTSRGTKAFLIPDSIKSNQWTVSIDLICTGLVLKAFDSIPHALDFFGEYWK